MKKLLILVLCLTSLDIIACRGPSLDREDTCSKQPSCIWTSNGCRFSLSEAASDASDSGAILPLGIRS